MKHEATGCRAKTNSGSGRNAEMWVLEIGEK